MDDLSMGLRLVGLWQGIHHSSVLEMLQSPTIKCNVVQGDAVGVMGADFGMPGFTDGNTPPLETYVP